jgi:hypothetical protein
MRKIYALPCITAFCIILASCSATDRSTNDSSSKSPGIFMADKEIMKLVSDCGETVINDFIDAEDNGVFLEFEHNLGEIRILSLWTHEPEEPPNADETKQKTFYLFFAYLHSTENSKTASGNSLRVFEIDVVAIIEYIEYKQDNKVRNFPSAEFPISTRVFLNSGFVHYGKKDDIWYIFYDTGKKEAKEIYDLLLSGFNKKKSDAG